MDATRFDAMTRALASLPIGTPTRRAVMAILASGLLTAGLGPWFDAEARKKKKRKKKKGCQPGLSRCTIKKGKKKGKKGKKKQCVDLQTNASHCGACGARCAADQSCQNGQCQSGAGGPTFTVSGRSILNAAGTPVVLRGVNIMSVFADDDPTGTIAFPEIAKTGANSVRIVWAVTKNLAPNGPKTDPDVLDALIANARANGLVPMIELHDATGNWSRLDELVAYWVQPRIVSIIAKHSQYLLVNIGNEVGDETVSDAQFIARYTNAVQTMRGAGIRTPLVIDASDWGKRLTTLNATAATLLQADPLRNLIFSVHMYWPIAKGLNAQFIKDELQKAVNANYPLVVGEFSHFGGFNDANSICAAGGATDYKTILEETQRHGIGWYAWEWGPGNGVNDPLCAVMDMTPDRKFANLNPGWATEVATTSPFSIKNTSRPAL